VKSVVYEDFKHLSSKVPLVKTTCFGGILNRWFVFNHSPHYKDPFAIKSTFRPQRNLTVEL